MDGRVCLTDQRICLTDSMVYFTDSAFNLKYGIFDRFLWMASGFYSMDKQINLTTAGFFIRAIILYCKKWYHKEMIGTEMEWE